MFAGFNLKLEENELIKFSNYEDIGREQVSRFKANFQDTIKKYLMDGIVDGTSIEKDWFPQIKADIFISHSHVDEKKTYGLAGWLYKNFGLISFIDSCVWGNIDDLLEMINKEYSDKRDDGSGVYLYNHKKCNTASKHVNTMLMVALQKMIDKTEVTILLNTSNSISKYDKVYEDVTYSPWINVEIICTQLVRRKPLKTYRNKGNLFYESREILKHADNEFRVKYDISLEHLEDINIHTLQVWKKEYDDNKVDYPLDYLYSLVFKEEILKKND